MVIRFFKFAFAAGIACAAPAKASNLPPLVFDLDLSDTAIERMQRSTSDLMSLNEERIRELIPVSSGGLRFVDCPNCDAGSADQGRFEWAIDRPGQVRCGNCGDIYPGNPSYPETGFIEIDAPDGTHRFDYWERPSDGLRVHFSARADYQARQYLKSRCREMAAIYHATEDENYARKAAAILERFAEVYPGYPLIYDFPHRQVRFKPYYAPGRMDGVPDYRVAKWEWWSYRDISFSLLQAYELLAKWPAWNPEAERRVRMDLLGEMVEYVRRQEESFGNMSPRVWRDMIYAGRVLERPEWVHDAVNRFQTMLADRFLYDGHWMETSPSYALQVQNTFESIREAVDGYSDPRGYRHPETAKRFDRFDLMADMPQYGMAWRAIEAPRFPSGRLLPINDTWARFERRVPARDPREEMEPVLLPGLGIAVLGGGEGDGQYHAYLNFTSGLHHKQRDALAIGLYAFGKELLPDLGYTHTRYRPWINSTMSHNTVVVDGRESEFDPEHTGNRPVEFVADGREFGIAAAESHSAYPGRTDTFRRTIFATGDDARRAYILDIFEVAGGSRHDYLLHGSADEDSSARIEGVRLREWNGSLMNPGVKFRYPAEERDHPGSEEVYGFIRELRRGLAKDATASALAIRLDANPQIGVRSVLATAPGDEIFAGRSPSIRRAQEVNQLLDDYWMPSVAWRKSGPEGFCSVFVAAHAPIQKDGNIVRALSAQTIDGVLVAQVRTADGGVDCFFVALDDEPLRVATQIDGHDVQFEGRYGAIRTDETGAVYAAHLVGGSLLSHGEWRMKGDGVFSGRIESVQQLPKGGLFELDRAAGFPSGPRGIFRVHFPDTTVRAFTVDDVESGLPGPGVRTVEYPGFHVDSGTIRLTSFPQRDIRGQSLRFQISEVRHYYRSGHPD